MRNALHFCFKDYKFAITIVSMEFGLCSYDTWINIRNIYIYIGELIIYLFCFNHTSTFIWNNVYVNCILKPF